MSYKSENFGKLDEFIVLVPIGAVLVIGGWKYIRCVEDDHDLDKEQNCKFCCFYSNACNLCKEDPFTIHIELPCHLFDCHGRHFVNATYNDLE